MKHYDDYDEYERGGFKKFSKHQGGKKKYKGHQSRHSKRDRIPEWNDDFDERSLSSCIESSKREIPIQQPVKQPIQQPVKQEISVLQSQQYTNNTPKVSLPHEHVFGPNTHTIKGVQIDMDGVEDIQMTERQREGQTTYGIKFIFKGTKQSFRIIWFNSNQLARDKTYANERIFWIKLQKKYG